MMDRHVNPEAYDWYGRHFGWLYNTDAKAEIFRRLEHREPVSRNESGNYVDRLYDQFCADEKHDPRDRATLNSTCVRSQQFRVWLAVHLTCCGAVDTCLAA